tara:strand:+ start:666 stop:863 length:198 start_codon:yes stop_codon:yes gene_type:complete
MKEGISDKDLLELEKQEKISELTRRLYYLKQYGIESIPSKRPYNKKDKNLNKIEIKKKNIILTFN